jgi:hypothetical protein
MRSLIAFCAAFLLSGSMARGEEPPINTCTLSQVLAARAKIPQSAAVFTQERRVHYVRDPLFSSGRLRFVAPDHLEMIVESPQSESFIYEDGVLSLQRGDENSAEEVSVESNLLLSAMFSGLVGTLSGNEEELRRVFFVEFVADACNWRMNLVPKSKRVLQKIQEIQLKGTDQHIEEFELLQANGDRSLLRITEQQ